MARPASCRLIERSDAKLPARVCSLSVPRSALNTVVNCPFFEYPFGRSLRVFRSSWVTVRKGLWTLSVSIPVMMFGSDMQATPAITKYQAEERSNDAMQDRRQSEVDLPRSCSSCGVYYSAILCCCYLFSQCSRETTDRFLAASWRGWVDSSVHSR